MLDVLFIFQVSDLYQQMKDHQIPIRPLSNATSLTSLSVDISPSSSNFIEVIFQKPKRKTITNEITDENNLFLSPHIKLN